MSAHRLAGLLWIIAGITCAGLLIFVFIGENIADPGILLRSPALPTLVLAGAIAALLTGSLLITHPSARVVRSSNVLGVAWLIGFGPLVVAGLRGGDTGPLLSSSVITGFGLAAALVAHWRHRSQRAVTRSR